MRGYSGLLLLLVLLAGCSTPRGSVGTGGPVIIGLYSKAGAAPNGVCRVRAGEYMTLTGQDFGTAEQWGSGLNRVIFAKESQVLAETPKAELTQASGPTTLVLVVPKEANPGPGEVEATIRVKVGEMESNAYAVVILPPLGGQMAVPGCNAP